MASSAPGSSPSGGRSASAPLDVWHRRAYDDAARAIEEQKDGLLDRVEEHLKQEVRVTDLFTITFDII